MINCLKEKGTFVWIGRAERTFAFIKEKATNAPILAFPNFKMVLKLECDACRMGIGAVISQKRDPLPFLSEKLNGTWQKCITKNYMRCTVHGSIGELLISL